MMIPYGRQEITEDDVTMVTNVLRSEYLTQGVKVPEFEDAISHHCSVKHAIAVNSATSALHLACMALNLGGGDLVWTTPITFVATANCAKYCGAEVDFVDIDPVTCNMSIQFLSEKLQRAKKNGKLPKIVIPVHFGGQSCEMEQIYDLSKTYGFSIIEDASHAIGGKYQELPIGNCKYSHITVFSFHPVKIITTGEGGAVTTNSDELAKTMRLLRSHGVEKDPSLMGGCPHGEWYYEQNLLGFNYRMTDMQAALGSSQIKRLDKYIESRNEIAKYYDAALSSPLIIKPFVSVGKVSAFHLYVVRIRDPRRPNLRDIAFREMRKNNIGVNVHYIPVHLQPYYKRFGHLLGYSDSSFPEALRYYSEAISLPIFPTLEKKEQDYVIGQLSSVVNAL